MILPTTQDMDWEDIVRAHKALITDHGVADSVTISEMAVDLSNKAKMGLPDAYKALAALGAYIVEQEQKGKRVWRK